jgi:hypothetical protein
LRNRRCGSSGDSQYTEKSDRARGVPTASTALQPLPRAIARRRRQQWLGVSRTDLVTYLLLVLGYVALMWYGLHLPGSRR